MKDKHLLFSFGAIVTITIILLFSCKKINSATELGGDLIPPVDNITTFDTTLNVEVYNDTFSITNDSTRYSSRLFGSNYEQFLGMISNDPFFGKTDARLYLQLKPPTFKWVFANKPDSLYIDSVVLVLSHVETYGDSTVPQTVNVYEIAQSSIFEDTMNYLVRENTIVKGNLLGTSTFDPRILDDSIKVYQDTTANQLRIRLDNLFGDRLLKYDTTANGSNNAYYSDSVFNKKFKGFALESVSGNAVMGFDLQAANTKLAIYYHYNKGGVGNFDTTVNYFNLTISSASANYVKREIAGTPFASSIGGTTSDNFAYVQSTPGSFITIKIPALAGLNNRVVHRAELIMEQAYDFRDSMFYPPAYLYLDAYDPAESKYRMIPYDVFFDANGDVNFNSFGSLPYYTTDLSGNAIRNWRFNLSRYVQHVVNGTEPVYDLRLFAPTYVYDQYKATSASTSSTQLLLVNSAIAKGRVRLFGNDGGVTNPQRMRLRIVYSKI